MEWTSRAMVMWLAGPLAAVLIAIACLRSVMGCFAPLDVAPMTAVALLATGATLVARWTLWHSTRPAWPELAALLPLAALAWAVSVPGTSAAALAILWATVVGGEALYWLVRFRLPSFPHVTRWNVEGPPALRAEHSPPLPAGLEDGDSDAESLLGDARLTQRTLRSHDEGCDTFLGEFRCRFAARERSQALHVAFCPPFDQIPEVFVEPIDGPEVDIKTTQLQPFGARFDLRLTRSMADESTVAVRVVARAPL